MSTFELVRSVDRLRALESDWQALAATARTPLLDHDWILSCAETFHADGDLRIGVLRNGSALEAAAPLALEATASGMRLAIAGASRLHEPAGWLFTPTASLAELVRPIVQLGWPLLLQRIPADSPLCRALPDVTRRRATTVTRATAPSLAVATRGEWTAYRATLSSQITTNLPRLRRRAERVLGRMEITEVTPAPSQVDALLETVVAIEGSGWKGRRGSSLGCRADLRGFFRRYCQRAAERRRLRVAMVSFGSEIGAIELSVNAYDRLWQLKIGYHETLAPYYPGLHLVEASIRSAFERGLEAYEFLGSAETWEERWRPERHDYRLIALYPWSAAGMIGAARDLTGAVLRRGHRRARAGGAQA
jgi:CelD/BcsL family acetyltransferase involved in cellulose biosynthesis